MGRKNQNAFIKKQKAEKKRKKKVEKQEKKEARKIEAENKTPEDMIAYIDEYGNIVDEKPEPKRVEPKKRPPRE